MRMTVAFAEMNEALKADFSETTQKLAPEFDEMAVVNGKDGYTPVKGVDYFDGKDGKDGAAGKDGYTPIKGVDYWTDADKAEITAAVIAALPVYGGETA